jgi:hypothetical protein
LLRGGFGVPADTSILRPLDAFLGLCVEFSLAVPVAFYPTITQLGDLTLVLLVWGLGLICNATYKLRCAKGWTDRSPHAAVAISWYAALHSL